MPTHEQFMQRAIGLAKRATGNTSPNPLVGAVIVRSDCIVAEGWHEQFGQAHAEINAISDAAKKQQPTQDATLYVSLEPCAHYGKTPPCTDAILKAGFSEVVIATSDTNTEASGGAERLKSAGIKVREGVCEALARETNRFFFHSLLHKTPFVIGKFASSLDGRTATRTGNSKWITGNAARQRGHVARQAVDAILIGAQTAINDQPQLTVRNPEAYQHTTAAHPLRIVLDSRGRVSIDNAVFDSSLPASTLVITTSAMPDDHANRLQNLGVEVLRLPCSANTSQPDLHALMQELGSRGVQSLLVEGGNSVLGSFLDAGLVNEVWAFLAPILIGGTQAIPSIGGLGIDKLSQAAMLRDISVEQLDTDLLIRGRIEYPNTDSSERRCTENLNTNREAPLFIQASENITPGEDVSKPNNSSEAS